MKFTEEKLEQAFIKLLGKQDIPHVSGKEIIRKPEEVLLKDDLRSFLLQQYKSAGLTESEAEQIIRKLETYSSSDLYESNKAIMKILADGFVFKREDPNAKDLWIYLVDYPSKQIHAEVVENENLNLAADPKLDYTLNSDNNIYKIVNQLEIEGYEKRIPDGILYINGVPVVVFEFKSAIREEATIYNAYEQLTVRYQRDIPELFKYNAFCVISDGVNNKAGSFFAPYDFYYAWRKVTGNETDVDGIDSMYSLIEGMFNHDRLRDIIRNFIYIPDASKKDEKIVCRYPQYYAANKLYNSIKLHQRPKGDGKGGTYFGATGCGKSFTMLFLSRLLMKSVEFSSPTIVLITDRTDLDDQLSKTFTNAKAYIGDNNIISVASRKQLRELLQGRNSGGVFLTTIHKFTEDTELLTKRTNVICISDEAHRSQINLDQKVSVDHEKGTIKKTYGFAKYLHDSLPNATYVGFTGTPIDGTLDVFGEIEDSYTMTESVKDEITKRIVYEGRAAKVLLNNSKLKEIEEYYKKCEEEGANEHQIEESKKATASMNSILGDPDRLKEVAKDFVEHYEKRISEGSTVKGKAMFVCSSRPIAYDLYKEIIAYLGARSSSFVDYASAFTKNFGTPEEWHTGNLPHRNKIGLIQSLTFRLADSLPQNILQKVEREIQGLLAQDKVIQKQKKYEKYLDAGYGCCALAHPEMAQVVLEALQYHDGDKYDLLAWSIMPNHVHVLIKTKDELPTIIQSWKSFTGKWALKNNKVYKLGIPKETDKFWMPDYWDRFIRDEEHFNNTINYIIKNPDKANLPKHSIAYKFTGCTITKKMKQELHPSQIKMIMTRGKDDEKLLHDTLGDKKYRKTLDLQFKNEKSNFKIAIVVDMWLTGFDVPFLDTMYIDKPIQLHSLIQTISRVNRNYPGKEKGLVVDYIGIKSAMNKALKKYSKGDKTNFEDIRQSIDTVKDQLDLLGKLFHKFDSSGYFTDDSLRQLDCLKNAAEFVQLTKELENRFMNLVKRMKAAYDICCGSEEFSQHERDSIHFYLAVRSIVFKLTKGEAPDTAQMNAKVREMIKEAIESDGVEEIFKLGDNNETNIDIFDADYLAKIDKIKLPNTKIKLLQQLLAKAIDEFKKVNKAKGIDFSKKMKTLVDSYNERKPDVLESDVLDSFTEEIIDLYHELRKEKESFGEMGIDFEEKAFFDILMMIAHKFDFDYPEDKAIELAKAVKLVVDDKAKYVDWNHRDDIKAELKMDLIKLLAKFGYPPITKDEVYKEILEQAENFKKYQ